MRAANAYAARKNHAEDSNELFESFWIGGFEGADHVNGSGQPLDPGAATGHIDQIDHDYEFLRRVGICVVRESLGWRLTETANGFDFTRLHRLIGAAQRSGTQILWTLSHYGVPPDVDYLDEGFVERFARFAEAAAREIKRLSGHSGPAPIYTPINEINFLSYAVAETGLMFPHCGDPAAQSLGYQIKRRLVRASLAATEAIRRVEPRARMMIVDPLVHVIAPDGSPELATEAALVQEYQWQSWDMITGRMDPELGGNIAALDIVGVNHYHSSQWEVGTGHRLQWHLRDSRRAPLSSLLASAHERFHCPIAVTETSHVGCGRAQWFDEMAAEVLRARRRGVPVEGFCLYPIVDRCDWETPANWHNSGLWDVAVDSNRSPANPRSRLLNFSYARALRRWQRRFSNSPINKKASMQTLIVFSHLRWDFVYQRPQHLLSRLAQHYRILFFEEPVRGKLTPFLERFAPCSNVEVLRPHTTAQATGFHDDQLPELKPLLAEYLRDFSITDYLVWFYTPMALPLLAELAPQAVIYDCMDELSAFKDAPRQMVQRETALMKRAQLVLTGGPSLYEVKRALHGNVRCFPSAVDAEHYSPGNLQSKQRRERQENADQLQAAIGRPRLGFFGVVDERFDVELIAAVADAEPTWNVVIVGPVVKIDSQLLPKRANIHWLGQQPYELLPHLVAQWDVCLLPFARNASTRFISPTKTLEYMAAEKPIVSAPIHDVVSLYGDSVAIAATPFEFIAACKAALSESEEQRLLRINRMQQHVAALTWQRTARAIRSEIDALSRRSNEANDAGIDIGSALVRTPAFADAAHVTPVDRAKLETSVPTLIVGAGPTGLAAAYHLGAGSLLVEREATVGGWCRSIVDNGFTFDHAGHIMFSNDPYVLSLYETLLGDNVHWQNREAWIFSKDVYTRYPFQGSLYGLPPKVLKECIMGAIEARFGPSNDRKDAKGDDARKPVGTVAPANFLEFIHKVWGGGIAKHFAIPYNRKLWAVPLETMETSWLGGRVPLPDLEQMIEGALEPTPAPMGPNARFGYPLRGGFQALMDGFLPHLAGTLMLNTSVTSVLPKRRVAILSDGRKVRYDSLISTMPLPALISACGDEAPAEIRVAARALRYVSVRCVNFGIARENVTDKHWIYYPEDTVFHRIFVQGNASPHCNAPGGFGFTCEITYAPSKPLPVDGAQLIELARQDCVRVGMLRDDDVILAANQVDMPCAYVVYDHARHANVELIRKWLSSFGITLAGRYSEWEYYNSDHAFIAGKRAAESVIEAEAAQSLAPAVEVPGLLQAS
ncbi:MAG: NAD(P)-binding protein [Pseudomonadota bacterium]|nr:NAD(P)-binding protein [Pseudomonadota bacterium]